MRKVYVLVLALSGPVLLGTAGCKPGSGVHPGGQARQPGGGTRPTPVRLTDENQLLAAAGQPGRRVQICEISRGGEGGGTYAKLRVMQGKVCVAYLPVGVSSQRDRGFFRDRIKNWQYVEVHADPYPYMPPQRTSGVNVPQAMSDRIYLTRDTGGSVP